MRVDIRFDDGDLYIYSEANARADYEFCKPEIRDDMLADFMMYSKVITDEEYVEALRLEKLASQAKATYHRHLESMGKYDE